MLKHLYTLLLISILLGACREDEYIVYMEEEDTGSPSPADGEMAGLYILCEGNMGSNKATLDYLDLSDTGPTARYYRNIYAERNPQSVKELGDVGNDIGIYGGRLWMVINSSNKVEVCTADSAHGIGKTDIPNGRYLAFDDGYAYVSSFVGPVQLGNRQLGRVYKVDTLTLQKCDSVVVGFQPEEMAICQGRLYVANSGGYLIPDYDSTVTVIDLKTFRPVDTIDVAPNLHRMATDRHGRIWVSSRGDYRRVPSRLYWLEPAGEEPASARAGDRDSSRAGRMQRGGSLDLPVSAMQLVGDSLYCIGTTFSYVTMQNEVCFSLVNVATREVVKTTLFDAPEIAAMRLPYSIVVNPKSRDFYLMDAKDYVSSGELLHFHADGRFDWRVWTGDIPSRGAWKTSPHSNPH